MKHLVTLSCLAALLTVAAPAAQAQQAAYTAKDVHLRAGPGREYPVVAVLRAGTAIIIDGCEADYRWCDVEVGSYRGWVYAGNIVAKHVGVNEPVLGYGAAMGIGIVLFDLGLYWDSHYRDRPWYAQRPHWINRPPPAHRPVPPRRPRPVPPAQPPRGNVPPTDHPRPGDGAGPRQPPGHPPQTPPVIQPPGRRDGQHPPTGPRPPGEGRGR